MLKLGTRLGDKVGVGQSVTGAETGGRAGAWPPYDLQIYTTNLNFD